MEQRNRLMLSRASIKSILQLSLLAFSLNRRFFKKRTASTGCAGASLGPASAAPSSGNDFGKPSRFNYTLLRRAHRNEKASVPNVGLLPLGRADGRGRLSACARMGSVNVSSFYASKNRRRFSRCRVFSGWNASLFRPWLKYFNDVSHEKFYANVAEQRRRI